MVVEYKAMMEVHRVDFNENMKYCNKNVCQIYCKRILLRKITLFHNLCSAKFISSVEIIQKGTKIFSKHFSNEVSRWGGKKRCKTNEVSSHPTAMLF